MAGPPIERRIRAICLSFPEATERTSHGAPAYFVKKQFVALWVHGHHDHQFPHMWCAAGPGVLEGVVAMMPDRFFRPPYVGGRGWLGVRLDTPITDDELATLCRDAYRAVAPRRLITELDASRS
jgi:hypothetical protein